MPPFVVDKIGQWSEPREFTVEADRTRAYAAATNDPVPDHVDGEIAPPVFAFVPIWDVMSAAVQSVTPVEALPFVLHGEQDMHFSRPIVPGMVLSSRAAPIGVQVKQSGTTVVSHMETRDVRGGELVNEQYTVTFFRVPPEGESVGAAAPDHRFPESLRDSPPVATVVQRFDDDQTFRYSKASGDMVPIHLDDDFAKSVGLPGIIIHGLCTMAFTSWAAIEQCAGGDSSRLKRLAVRFAKPCRPGQQVVTRFYAAGEREDVVSYVFETTDPEGELVIKDGVAEIAR